MDDDQGTQDPSQQTVTVSASEFPSLYADLQCTSADDLLQLIGIDPSTISDDNDSLPNA